MSLKNTNRITGWKGKNSRTTMRKIHTSKIIAVGKVLELEQITMDMINVSSVEYRAEKKIYVGEVLPDKLEWLSGSKFASSGKSVIVEKTDATTKYYMLSGERAKIYAADVTAYKNVGTRNFDDFISQNQQRTIFEYTTCTCVKISKNYTCQHIAGMGMPLCIITMPDMYAYAPIEVKTREPGRPKKARNPLQKDCFIVNERQLYILLFYENDDKGILMI